MFGFAFLEELGAFLFESACVFAECAAGHWRVLLSVGAHARTPLWIACCCWRCALAVRSSLAHGVSLWGFGRCDRSVEQSGAHDLFSPTADASSIACAR